MVTPTLETVHVASNECFFYYLKFIVFYTVSFIFTNLSLLLYLSKIQDVNTIYLCTSIANHKPSQSTATPHFHKNLKGAKLELCSNNDIIKTFHSRRQEDATTDPGACCGCGFPLDVTVDATLPRRGGFRERRRQQPQLCNAGGPSSFPNRSSSVATVVAGLCGIARGTPPSHRNCDEWWDRVRFGSSECKVFGEFQYRIAWCGRRRRVSEARICRFAFVAGRQCCTVWTDLIPRTGSPTTQSPHQCRCTRSSPFGRRRLP